MTASLVAEPVVIAHRGVPGSRLEHTRPSYLLGIEEGADYIEPDVVATKDGVLVVRHENEIGGTTDVADRPEFAHLRTTKFIDGLPLTGWFTEDFTLEEIKTLRTRERLPRLRPQNLPLNDTEPLLTLDEVIDIADAENARRGPDAEPIGVYVETKHPTYFRGLGLDLNDRLIEVLERRGLNREGAKVTIQSMETSNLKALRDRTPLPLVQLMERMGGPYDLVATYDPRDYAALTTPRELAKIAEYAQGIGPNKSLVIARDTKQHLLGETGLVRDAHEVGLFVHIWTMRNENNFLPRQLRTSEDKAAPGDATAELLAFYAAGVDGVFSDFTRTAVAARTAHRSGRPADTSGTSGT
ncbi:glycerophosphoryl diester phosphodiesterase [Aeromicrobium flavum]|uniref:glycerophosphodiester phosphodiesterase n=1 Tax=Aeromicrobium flavum TaxID=416568 RepID=A0A512HTF5_9ACTN|nr:glycerophosphodiester phosphodiesterase family protein [Aeromicrobium flavum]GEO88738.1 glycerophosphoryl diester phosphodiesterase [Aeromicrobium flavum]